MRALGASGVWELFVPGVGAGALYKFEIRNRATGALLLKADPYARTHELRPGTASRIAAPGRHAWRDAQWLERRAARDWLHAPMSIYEVHAAPGGATRTGGSYNYRELADALVPYVVDMGFTHIELLPLTEHPLDDSWGYQTTGYFAPTSRYGAPDDLRALVDACHAAGIGVLLDWVPAHFPRDALGARALRRHRAVRVRGPAQGRAPDWGTHVFNYERHEVRASCSRAPTTGSRSSTSTGCASTRSPRCSTSTTRASPASGCRTATAGARTSRRSSSCAS